MLHLSLLQGHRMIRYPGKMETLLQKEWCMPPYDDQLRYVRLQMKEWSLQFFIVGCAGDPNHYPLCSCLHAFGLDACLLVQDKLR
jgi:hypothetical protein